MKPFLMSAALVLGMATAASADPIVGTWASEKNKDGASLHVKINSCGSAICGTVAKVLGHPNKSPEGRQMIWDMKPVGGGEYSGGRVWAPDRNKTYRGKLLLKGNTLTMSGCVMGGTVCRDSKFTRLK